MNAENTLERFFSKCLIYNVNSNPTWNRTRCKTLIHNDIQSVQVVGRKNVEKTFCRC